MLYHSQLFYLDLVLFPQSRAASMPAMSDTPRGSWASSIFDLRNSAADPLLPNLLERVHPDDMDAHNAVQRGNGRQDALFALFPQQPAVSLRLGRDDVFSQFLLEVSGKFVSGMVNEMCVVRKWASSKKTALAIEPVALSSFLPFSVVHQLPLHSTGGEHPEAAGRAPPGRALRAPHPGQVSSAQAGPGDRAHLRPDGAVRCQR